MAKQKPMKVFFTYDRALNFDKEKALIVLSELINRLKSAEKRR